MSSVGDRVCWDAAAPSVEELLARARMGDRRARERAFRQTMPLARQLAWQYRRGREPVDDLLQVAYLGLTAAINRFDPARGTRFVSFARPTISGELLRHFRDTSWAARMPRALQENVLTVRRASDALAARLGRSPRVEELADATGLDVEQVAEALHANSARHAASLDGGAEDEEDALVLADVVGVEDERFERVERRATVGSLVRTLSPRDRELLFMRFAEDMTQSEIAARIGCSQMQVSRLLRRALAQLAADHRDLRSCSLEP
ncbi:MAG: SigB/SigF/SigG family RNA polymerase sigma factor [Conexibacter sp.]